jgi:hypothetical protein
MAVKHKKDGATGRLLRTDGRLALVKWECHAVPLLCYLSDLEVDRA